MIFCNLHLNHHSWDTPEWGRGQLVKPPVRSWRLGYLLKSKGVKPVPFWIQVDCHTTIPQLPLTSLTQGHIWPFTIE